MATIKRLQPGALYSGAVVHGDTVYLAGKVAPDKTADVTSQTKQVLAEIDKALAEAGSDKSKLLTVQIWLKDIKDFAAMNAVYTAWVDQDNKPCRATVEAALATPDYLVEIMCVAAK